jgi:PAS domain S-box-containing protein
MIPHGAKSQRKQPDQRITGQKWVEEELRQSERRFRALAAATFEGIAITEGERLVDVNEQLAKIAGYEPHEMIGLNVASLMLPEDREWIMANIRAGTESRIEHRMLRKDGGVIWVEAHGQTSTYLDRPVRFTAIRDVTERKRAEEAIRESHRQREFLARLLELSSQPFGVGYPDGRLGMVNPACERLLGYTAQELNTINWSETLTPPEWRELERRKLEELHRTGLPVRYEKEYIHKDGTRVPVELLVHLIADADGLPYYYAFVTDITERKQVEAALREKEERLALFIEQAPAVLAMFDRDMCYVCASRAWRLSAHLGDRDVRGLSHYEQQPDIPERWKEAHRRGLAGEVVGAECDRWERSDGSVQWMQWEIRPWHDSAGQIGGIVIFAEDVTSRKRAEEALIRNEKLASAGRMAMTIAHEINNPLEAVMNSLFLARSCPELPDSVRHHLDVADQELQRVAHITRQSLGFYREQSNPATVSVNAIMDSALDILKSKIKAKHAVVEKQYDTELLVNVVSGEIRQVFSNLLANSLDAIAENGRIRIHITEAHNDGRRRARVTVADNGKGIGRATLKHIFEPFFTTKEAVGIGLGLWVSKQLVEKHGGRIRVRSATEGTRRGAIFSVTLPMA